MNLLLLDEQGQELSEVTSHVGKSPGQLVVDWATRPDALFRHYFDRSSRTVTAVTDAARWSAVLGTRWQMGARRWFLHELSLARPHTEGTGQARALRTTAGDGGKSNRRRSGRAPAAGDPGSRTSLNRGHGGGQF